MEGLVVSLDSELKVLTRVWVLAEIGKAQELVREVKSNMATVQFRIVDGLDANSEPRRQLDQAGRSGTDDTKLMSEGPVRAVDKCDASSPFDKKTILQGLDDMKGRVAMLTCILLTTNPALCRWPKCIQFICLVHGRNELWSMLSIEAYYCLCRSICRRPKQRSSRICVAVSQVVGHTGDEV